MDGDFQSNYLAAEQAYAAGDFQTARSTVLNLLDQLEPLPESGNERQATLAWRAFVALLAGHIHLYGLNETDQARGYYELVLASNPQDTLRDLAEQGLERSRENQPAEIQAEPGIAAPTNPGTESSPVAGSPELIRDPFLKQSCDSIQPDQSETAEVSTATPWLADSSHGQTETVISTTATSTKAIATTADALKASASTAIKTEAIEHNSRHKQEMEMGISKQSGPMLASSEAQTEAQTPSPENNQIELSQTDCEEDPLIKQALKQRLETGRLRVKLPDQPATPSKRDAGSNAAKARWAWLLAALRRS